MDFRPLFQAAAIWGMRDQAPVADASEQGTTGAVRVQQYWAFAGASNGIDDSHCGPHGAWIGEEGRARCKVRSCGWSWMNLTTSFLEASHQKTGMWLDGLCESNQ